MAKSSKKNQDQKVETPVETMGTPVETIEETEITEQDTTEKEANPMTDAAARMQELLASGMSMEDALEEVMKTVKPVVQSARTSVDRLSLMREETNIEALRKRIKIAFAKKSKSANNPVAAERYQKEIEEGQARLNELLCQVESSEDPVAAAIEAGEAKGTVLQMLIKDLENEAKEALEGMAKDQSITQKTLKDMTNQQRPEVTQAMVDKFNKYDPEFLKIFTDRIERNDQRCITLAKRFQLMEFKPVEVKVPEAPIDAPVEVAEAAMTSEK